MDPFQLGNWQVSPKLNELKLLTGEFETSVTPKIMQLLVTLVKQRDSFGHDPLSIDALINTVWAERVVADSSVYQAVAQLRKVLSQDTDTAIYIERISGQGYRIAIDVTVQSIKVAQPEQPQIKTTKGQLFYVVLFSVLLITTAIVWFSIEQTRDEESPHFESLSLARHLIKQTDPVQLEQAKQLYLDVLELEPNNVEALNRLCDSYRLLTVYGTLTEIERDSLCHPLLEKAFQLAPENHRVLASMARQASEMKQIDQAQSLFERSLAINNENAFTWHWYGRLKRKQNKIDEALSAHNKAFRLAPNNALILRGLAYAHLNNRDLINAHKYYERSLVITPNFKNKPLYDLDFYPLNVSRAKRYLTWFNTYESEYLKKYLSHKLSYIVFLLSINQGELAQSELEGLTEEQLKDVPTHFILYVKAALASYNQLPEQALTFLSQRYQIAPKQNHFVMPYIIALVNNEKHNQALTLFDKHFPNVRVESINRKQLGQHLLLARLYKLNGRKTEYQKVYSKLLSYRQTQTQFPLHLEIVWSDVIDDTASKFTLLTTLLEQGWLPDYNDSIFIEKYYSSLLNTSEQLSEWRKKLRAIQACIWQPAGSDLCK
jgi:DNA-binding winged helix-turn-helix (wHTH) protein